ncbi:MAG: BPTD_3080 family restriction endonuclease [Planctomycetota bacterium]
MMGMLAAWSILNKLNSRGDARFSDVVLIVCPNVTIRNRLEELKPQRGDASLYVTRDLVPKTLMPDLSRGVVLVKNWHEFMPQEMQADGARVMKRGQRVIVKEEVHIGPKDTTARGKRFLTLETYRKQVNAGILEVDGEETHPKTGALMKAYVQRERYIESDTALVNRVLGQSVAGKKNILVFNDEAHHAYRHGVAEADPDESGDDEDVDEEDEYLRHEATVWIEGLDRINKLRGLNMVVDLSATPYFLQGAGRETNRPFPWIVSDFGLVDAIESGLVKVPQIPLRDVQNTEVAAYFNLWQWVMDRLGKSEKGGKKGNPKPEAVLRYAATPIEMLASKWLEEFKAWSKSDDPRPPVFIVVCKNTKLAKTVFEWIAEGSSPASVPAFHTAELSNTSGRLNTIRVDTKVVEETDAGGKSDANAWMRHQLDTVGLTDWPTDSQGRPVYPEGFEALANKLDMPLHPPGRDIRCIVSVGMLTEGWDCKTVTHIVGLRPFQSQLLCEQVVGRGLRRTNYETADDGRFSEEVAQIIGVPFDFLPFKAEGSTRQPPPRKHHVHALPDRAIFQISFPRVTRYESELRTDIAVDWATMPRLKLDTKTLVSEYESKAAIPSNVGRPSFFGPGQSTRIDLQQLRDGTREQQIVFDLAARLTKRLLIGDPSDPKPPPGDVTAREFFLRAQAIVSRYLREYVDPGANMDRRDVHFAPFFGMAIDNLHAAIEAESSEGPERIAESTEGSTLQIDFWTSREVREAGKCHLNYVVADTVEWEQRAAALIERNEHVFAFVKNTAQGLVIPYMHEGMDRDYIPDFLVRLAIGADAGIAYHLIVEIKGRPDPREQLKTLAAHRWVAACNVDAARFGHWQYVVVRDLADLEGVLAEALRTAKALAESDAIGTGAVAVGPVAPTPDEPEADGVNWAEWVTASATRNYALDDPLLDWLKLHGQSKGFVPDYKRDGYDERADFSKFIMAKGQGFEDAVVHYVGTLEEVRRIGEGWESSRDPQAWQATIDAMKAGVPIIHQAVLRDPGTQTYGMADLLVRSDVLLRLFPHAITPVAAAVCAPGITGEPWHYRVLDVKYTTLDLKAGGDLADSGSSWAYKLQVWIYNRALGGMQGYVPPEGFLLGRGYKQTRKGETYRGISCMDRLGAVPTDYESRTRGPIEHVVEAACRWVRRLRASGSGWTVEPMPSVPELWPNMSNSGDQPWSKAKREIADRLHELTQLWQVGPEGRRKAHAAGVYRWTDPACTPDVVDVTGPKRAPVLQALLDVNREANGDPVRPKQIAAARDEWHTPGPLEFFVDFETVSSVDDDFSRIPEQNGRELIFMVGCGHIEVGEWRFKCFIAGRMDLESEARVIDQWFSHMAEVKQRLSPKGDEPRVFHWSPAETSTLSTAYNSACARHPGNTWPTPNWFDYLGRVVKAEPVVVRGALGFGLKAVANAMHRLGLTQTSWTSGPTDGLGAMVAAWRCAADASANGANMPNLPLMREIAEYNEVDCRVMADVIGRLRTH